MSKRHAIYEWFRDHPRRVDLFLMLGLLLVLAGPFLGTVNPISDFLLSAALIVPLAFRRSRPVPATAVVAVVCLGQWAVAFQPVPGQISVLLLVYACAAYAPRWASIGALVLALIGGVMLVARYWILPGVTGLGDIPIYVIYVIMIDAVVLVCWTFGDLTRTRRLQLQALQDRARRLEIEREQERELAAADERSHIAREMHDIVAHSLSVIITQADGGRYASAADPAAAPRTLETIAETGRTSLREMRRLLGVLRGEDEASTRPLPSLADIDELISTLRRAGLQVQCRQTGKLRRQLPSGAELTAYRIVQESLTNVLKHAGPHATAQVELRWDPRGLSICVHDDGRGAAADPKTTGAGQGIRGMTERITLYDGSLTAAPESGGGFRVEALIPYSEA